MRRRTIQYIGLLFIVAVVTHLVREPLLTESLRVSELLAIRSTFSHRRIHRASTRNGTTTTMSWGGPNRKHR